jgi:hypothetical protein
VRVLLDESIPVDFAKDLGALGAETVIGLGWAGLKNGSTLSHVICFFQDAAKFKTRYATFGFSDKANLDEGHMWPNAFALTKLTAEEEARIAALVKQAAS